MVVMDTLSNALSAIQNAEVRAKSEVVLWPASKLVLNVLRVLQKEGYVGEFEYIDDGRWGKIKVQLLGRINKIGVVKPRHPVSYRELEEFPEWLKRYLPAYNIGILIVSTPQGVMSHKEAVEKKTGGVLLAYCY
ncbi:30S ribosomal protein S8 [Thermosphaera aggregans]|jgi:small subunit ribosomal protein S8|uniref:Small ribosomal subunit protein uS8 n=1 Tax=Thermosphaera aggregans (strain DSM 11486 / M11TL) TaxID=633148 RepID=D5U1Y5_THEAM|nr:30S ribosomal protein S8 [Thermosphaera aggregans]ADG91135.1 SSU ribosomal protein S8P [Thermosphaera aggregans DSM 11486]